MTDVRQAGIADAAMVGHHIWRLINEVGGDPSKIPPVEEYVRRAQIVLRMTDRVWAFLAWDDDTSIGTILLNECVAIYANGVFGEISELYIDPNYRSRGVALNLLASATDFGRARGWSRLEVGTPLLPKWERTEKFYRNNGFNEVGLRLERPIVDCVTG
jgi:GNAT superfamily N-acetyltransferase